MVTVREEKAQDSAAIRYVNEQAFGRVAEADLVDALRRNGKARVSLIAEDAEDKGCVVGHILFSSVVIEIPPGARHGVGLAPLAVLPAWQRRGIGALLVKEGLAQCRAAGHSFVVVLGHAEYYPRFGFTPASHFNIRSEYDVADENFMALELQPNALSDCTGVVRYQPEFH